MVSWKTYTQRERIQGHSKGEFISAEDQPPELSIVVAKKGEKSATYLRKERGKDRMISGCSFIILHSFEKNNINIQREIDRDKDEDKTDKEIQERNIVW